MTTCIGCGDPLARREATGRKWCSEVRKVQRNEQRCTFGVLPTDGQVRDGLVASLERHQGLPETITRRP